MCYFSRIENPLSASGWKPRAILPGFVASLFLLWNAAGVTVDFGAGEYVAIQGGTVLITVEIDYEPGDPMDLFSYGVRVIPGSTESIMVVNISVPPELDFLGFRGPGALVDTSVDVLGVKGTIDVLADPRTNYGGSLLATFELAFFELGEVTLDLELFRTLGPTEDVFVAGDGTTLDENITFGSATVNVLTVEEVFPKIILAFAGAGNADIQIHFLTMNGFTYVLQWSDDLNNWTDLMSWIGDGSEAAFTDPGAGLLDQRFYQVVINRSGP